MSTATQEEWTPGDPPPQLVRDLSRLLDLPIMPADGRVRPRLLVGADRCLYLRLDDSRLVVDVARPKSEPDGWYFSARDVTFPSITASILRKPEQIAREIERRVLPAYEAAWQAYLRDVTEHRTYVTRVQRLRDRTRAALGRRWDARDAARASSQDASHPTVNLTFTNELYGDVRISGDCARFELNVTGSELVVAVAAFLADLPSRPKEDR